jgi:hypothetical protein
VSDKPPQKHLPGVLIRHAARREKTAVSKRLMTDERPWQDFRGKQRQSERGVKPVGWAGSNGWQSFSEKSLRWLQRQLQ